MPQIFANPRFGLVSWVSYMYYLLFEMLSPAIEVFGILTVGLAACFVFEFSVYGTVFCAVHHLRRSDDAYRVFSAHLHAEPADHSAGRGARAVDVPAGKHGVPLWAFIFAAHRVHRLQKEKDAMGRAHR